MHFLMRIKEGLFDNAGLYSGFMEYVDYPTNQYTLGMWNWAQGFCSSLLVRKYRGSCDNCLPKSLITSHI